MRTKLFLLFTLFTLQSNAQCWSKISSGAYHTIALAQNGTLWGWGYNNDGQIGIGNATNQSNPIQIGNDNDWVSVGTGCYHSFAIKSNGTLWAWGDNTNGQLGNGNVTDQYFPVQIGTSQWQEVVGGEAFTLAIKTDGSLWSWGNNAYGQLGDGTAIQKNSPVQVGSDTNWWQIAAGRYHSYALKTTKKLWGWGYNHKGQVGDGSITTKFAPTALIAYDFNYIASGLYAGFAIRDDGFMYAWGAVNGVDIYAYTPFLYASSFSNWTAIKVGLNHFVGIRTVSGNDLLYTWGTNNFGQLGTATSGNPVQNTSVGNMTAKIAVNFNTSFALNSTGQVFVTGQNHVGQFGNGTLTDVNGFISVSCPAAVLETETFDNADSVSLYPNPVKNTLNISLSDNSEIQKAVIYDVTGKQVKFQDGNVNAISVEDLESGFYIFEVTIDGKKDIKKFIKQ